MTYWWQQYGLKNPPFLVNKPLNELEMDLLVETNSFKDLLQYFPSGDLPKNIVVLIYGTFGSGKTTMINYLKTHWTDLSDVKIHYVNANIDSKTYEDFERYILGVIYEGISDQTLDENVSVVEITKRFQSTLVKYHHVFLVDETHKVAEKFVIDFLRAHQAIFEKLKELPVTLFIAGQEALAANIQSEKGGILGVFDLEIPLSPLGEEEAIELVEKRLKKVVMDSVPFHNPLTTEAISRMVEISRGIPRDFLKLADKVFKENANTTKPIVIDEVSITRATSDITGEKLMGIRRMINTPAYNSQKKKLENLFADSTSPERVHDYLVIIDKLYSETIPIPIDVLIERTKLFGNLERVIKEMQGGVISSGATSEKQKYGIAQITLYSLDTSFRTLLNAIYDKYKLAPAAYLDRISSNKIEKKEELTSPDRLLKFFAEATGEIKDQEAVRIIDIAYQLYIELKSEEFSSLTRLNHYVQIMESLLVSYNIFSRNEKGVNFENRLSNAIIDMNNYTSQERSDVFSSNIKVLVEINKKANLEFGKIDETTLPSVFQKGDQIIEDILDLFYYRAKSQKNRESTNKSLQPAVTEEIADLNEQVRKLQSVVNELNLKIDKKSIPLEVIKANYLKSICTRSDNLKSHVHPQLIDGFFAELNLADAYISKELQMNTKTYITEAVITAIRERIQQERLSNEDITNRKKSLELLTAALEEFARYISSTMPKGNQKDKILSKESSLGRILGPLLGEEFSSRIFKYNSGNLADVNAEKDKEIETSIKTILEGSDPKLEELGKGPSQLILTILIRNYESHTLREKIVASSNYFTIFDQIISGFIWFYEYAISKGLIGLEKVLLYVGGTQPKLVCSSEYSILVTLGSIDSELGMFIVCSRVYEDKTNGTLVVFPLQDKINPVFDISDLPKDVSLEYLPTFHKICLEEFRKSPIDVDQNLFFTKIFYYDVKGQNNTRHNGEIAFFDQRDKRGLYASRDRSLENYYSLVFQSGLSGMRYPILTPVRFFTSLEEVISFLQYSPYPFEDIPLSDKNKIRASL